MEVKLYTADDGGKKSYLGVLYGYEGGEVKLVLRDDSEKSIKRDAISRMHTVFFED